MATWPSGTSASRRKRRCVLSWSSCATAAVPSRMAHENESGDRQGLAAALHRTAADVLRPLRTVDQLLPLRRTVCPAVRRRGARSGSADAVGDSGGYHHPEL